jgi:hypothetical protein
MMTDTQSSSLHRSVSLRLFEWLDRYFGPGSYRHLKRWLDPQIEYSQITYGRLLKDSLEPPCSWLEAGCGHEILKHGAGTEQSDFSPNTRSAVGCDLDMRSLRSQKANVQSGLLRSGIAPV